MAIDRSKFKSTSVAAVVQQDKEVSSMVGTKKGDRAGYLKLKPGKNLFRIFPPHPVEENEVGGTSFVEPKSTVWLPMMVEERDEQGKPIMGADGKPKMKEGNKTVFNSRIHGNTEKDIVEEYFKCAEEWAKKHKFDADAEKDKKKRKEFTDKIWGNFAAKIQGIRYNHNWVLFAKDLMDSKQPFGLLELKPSIKDGINKVVNMEASNQPIGTEANDPFTDVEEGRALVIMYNDKADKPADYYSTSIDTATEAAEMNGRKIQIQKVYPLTDDDLNELMKFPSLYKTFRNCFKRRDFMLQFTGLEYFDKKNGMGIFASPEFEAIIEEISAYYPEDEKPSAEEVAAVVNNHGEEAEEETETESETTDKFALMSRDELKAFSLANKTGILVKQTMTDDVLRERLREWEEATAINGEEEEETAAPVVAETTTLAPVVKPEPVAEKKEEPAAAPAPKAMSAADKLKAMKERQKASA